MRVLYFGSYDPNYARNWVLINGLKANGAKVLECNEKAGGKTKKYLKLFFKYWKFKGKYDVMVVGFPGQETMFLARFLRPFGLIIFDAFTSHYGGYILDRKKAPKNSLKAKYYRFLDAYSCKLADLVLLDTNAHIDFFIHEFKLPREKFRRIWVGADAIFQPEETIKKDNKFRILFFGNYIPLQGAEYIIRAAKIVLEKDNNIIFKLVGNGQDRTRLEILAKNITANNIEFKDRVPLLVLKQEIALADICLGIFGDTPKTPLVIPNKVYDSVAMKKPVITADTPAIRELFDGSDLYLVKAASPEDLARAIMELRYKPELRHNLAERGYRKFIEHASYKILGSELLKMVCEIINRNKNERKLLS